MGELLGHIIFGSVVDGVSVEESEPFLFERYFVLGRQYFLLSIGYSSIETVSHYYLLLIILKQTI